MKGPLAAFNREDSTQSVNNAAENVSSQTPTGLGASILRAPSGKTQQGSLGAATKQQENIYDVPIIEKPNKVEKSDESSDDDEENNPVYWNVLMMKHRSLDSSKLFANLEKRNFTKPNLPSMFLTNTLNLFVYCDINM
jgi:hypothetical protein